MKIGLVFPNKDRKDKTVHLGLGYLASYSKSIHKDLDITILDTRISSQKEENKFFDGQFDLIGITVLSPVYTEVIEIFKFLKDKKPNVKICLGGPYVSTIMEEIFEMTPADYAVYGEGEITFSDLIFHLKGEKAITEIDGLMYKTQSGQINTNPPRKQINNLDSLPFPAYDLFQMDKYPLHRIVTSRGCPYKCSFCNSTSIWENTWRERSAENVVTEIEYLISNYKKKTFCFSDNSFNIDMSRVDKFCDIIIEKKLNFLWSTPVRVENINQELAKKMKNAGCFNVGIGVESANNSILENLGKRTTIEQITDGISVFKKAGIEVLGQFVIGSPGDTLETVKESINYANNSELDFVMFYSILPYKGTPQWEFVKSNGNLYTDKIHNYHSIRPRVVFDTPEFSYSERIKAINMATDAGYYCDSNERSDFFDLGRDLVKKMQYILPDAMGNMLYIFVKNLYRKHIWKGVTVSNRTDFPGEFSNKHSIPYRHLKAIGCQMEEIPGGEILLRDDRTKCKWTVELEPFLLAKYPVTQDLYFAITGKSPGTFTGGCRPVETVSWLDAVNFCNILSKKAGFSLCYSISEQTEEISFDSRADGYRLPTEAEWQYACQAGTREVRYGEVDKISWYRDNSGGTTHEVGKKEPNILGLYDMLGNVWEWCWDIYDEKNYGSYRVIRGGGWNDPERGCLATNRRRGHPSFQIDDLGFRIARSIH